MTSKKKAAPKGADLSLSGLVAQITKPVACVDQECPNPIAPVPLGEGAAPVLRERMRSGLIEFEQITVVDPSSAEGQAEIEAAFADVGSHARLARVKQRADKYPDVKTLQSEVAYVSRFIDRPKFGLVVSWALTAIERGLDLLDTGRYLPNVMAGQKYRQRQRDWASSPRKIAAMQRNRIRSAYAERVAKGERHGAIKALADEFGVDRSTISTILREKK